MAPERPRGRPPGRRRGRAAEEPGPEREPAAWRRGFLSQAALLAAVFAGVSALAELFGAANLGTALGTGQIAFAIALVALLVRGGRGGPGRGRAGPREGPRRPR